MPVPEDQEPHLWMSLKQWNEEPPTPPSGGGGGLPSGIGIALSPAPAKSAPSSPKAEKKPSSYKYILMSERGCVEGETPLESVLDASLEVKRLKASKVFVPVDLNQAQFVIIWAAKNDSQFIESCLQKAGKRSVIVLNKPEHVQRLISWTKNL
jgi:hypothetical protein